LISCSKSQNIVLRSDFTRGFVHCTKVGLFLCIESTICLVVAGAMSVGFHEVGLILIQTGEVGPIHH